MSPKSSCVLSPVFLALELSSEPFWGRDQESLGSWEGVPSCFSQCQLIFHSFKNTYKNTYNGLGWGYSSAVGIQWLGPCPRASSGLACQFSLHINHPPKCNGINNTHLFGYNFLCKLSGLGLPGLFLFFCLWPGSLTCMWSSPRLMKLIGLWGL